MTLYVPSTLSVSRKKKLDCEELADYLSKLGINTLVTSNISNLPHREYGCQLTQAIQKKKDVENIWYPIKERYGFHCAHISVANIFNGCIMDFLSDSKCSQ